MLPYTDFVDDGIPLSALSFSEANLATIRQVYSQFKFTCDVSNLRLYIYFKHLHARIGHFQIDIP